MHEEIGGRGRGWFVAVALLSLAGCNSRTPAAPPPEHEAIPPETVTPGPTVVGTTPPPPVPHHPRPTVIKRRDFPLITPSLGGYTVTRSFTSDDVILPAAVVWPKVDGAKPFDLERFGTIYELGPDTARQVLDFSASVVMHGESGALGMALHPEFGDGTGSKPYVYVWYNARGGFQRLSRFTWDVGTRTFLRDSELKLVEEAETRPMHNAGRMQFGPDGFLYFGNGDDLNTANHQRLDRALFAGIFRIDVDSRGGNISHPPPRQPEGGHTQGYFIPNDNPFVGTPNAMEEFFALGFRNPYALSFDRQTGALWMGDVGDTFREEINLVLPGGNYEWPYREGELVRGGTVPTIGVVQPPKYFYTHADQGDLTAVLGGFVYRGHELPELVGKYLYTDYPSCRVWALTIDGPAVTRRSLIENLRCDPTGLAEDNDGEVYLMSVGGISKLQRDETWATLPTTLSETFLFDDVAALQPSPSLVPYELNSPLWSDGAAKQRWISVPPGGQVTVGDDGALQFPVGTILVKQFDLPASVTPQGRGTRRLETRVLVVGTENTYGLAYRWNAWGSDAELVYEPTDLQVTDTSGGPARTWHFPGFGQCWSCHRPENRVLGFTAPQVRVGNQLEVLARRGVFSSQTVAQLPSALPKPSDTSASLEERATAYLAANCSGCHHPGASYLGGGETWNAQFGVPLADRGLVNAPHHNGPMARALNLPNAPLIKPGDPAGSLLLARLKTTNPDLRMPPLARNMVDPDGVALIEAWIRSMPAP